MRKITHPVPWEECTVPVDIHFVTYALLFCSRSFPPVCADAFAQPSPPCKHPIPGLSAAPPAAPERRQRTSAAPSAPSPASSTLLRRCSSRRCLPRRKEAPKEGGSRTEAGAVDHVPGAEGRLPAPPGGLRPILPSETPGLSERTPGLPRRPEDSRTKAAARRCRQTSPSAATRTTSWLSHVPVLRPLLPHQARQCPPPCQCRCRRSARHPRLPRPRRLRRRCQRTQGRQGPQPGSAMGPNPALPAP